MVAINFQRRFAEAVETGRKRQTIRAKARCKPGDALQLYVGQRTKACRKLGDAVCKSVVPVEIEEFAVVIDRVRLSPADSVAFAQADGFPGFCEMADWFEDNGGLPFDGYLISWELADA